MSTRRAFLKGLSSAAVLPLCGACASAQPRTGQPEAHGPVAGGNVADLVAGQPKLANGQPVVIVLDSSGVYAMSTICTHQQCDMRNDGSIGSDGLSCSCHGSSFDIQGGVSRGPARRELRHYLVEIDASGEITVQADQVVDAAARTPLPA